MFRTDLVHRPGDTDYDVERAGFQTADQHRPSAIFSVTGAAEVQAAVRFARAQDLPIAVQATGHGLSTVTEGGVLINTRRMSEVEVDPVARTVRFTAGVRWGRVIEESARHGLAPLNGSSPDVGAVSYTLAGGLGILARSFGYAADHVRGIEIVTADGQLRHVSPGSEPDLFWALRGGGHNFGVVTAMTVDLFPVSRLYGGGLYFGTELIPDVLRSWRDWSRGLPEEWSSSVAVIPFPDLPMVPEPLRGRRVAHIRVAYTGDAASGEWVVAPLREIGPRLIDNLREMPYTESHTICNDPAHPHSYAGDNALMGDLSDEALAAVLNLPASSVIQLNHLGGALAKQPAVGNAVGHRSAEYLVRLVAVGGTADVSSLAPWSIGRSLNFLFGAKSAEVVRSAYESADFARLTSLKAEYDSANLFRCNHNFGA
ncbi:FAD-binding oxidoreductase [Kutzneria albida]|uniref:FAD-binding PCMH-type domain-containing protein n=1 Tax=Kutzneria albida DSM 43870 TaxID=1449976 RepID=W5WMM3_9PSEU|nr:FAD-dependent oxidoreductase [Kutzneria albida]AHI02026.1 hypothetical protein KALB_8669 [Kutzneria albida DSM 43870]